MRLHSRDIMDRNLDKNIDNNTSKNNNKTTDKNMDKSKGKIRGHHIFSNTPGLVKDFIDLCLLEIAKEGYQGTSLKSASWTRIMEKLNITYQGAKFDQKALKNRWDNMKKKYMVWRELINKSGNGYNANAGIFNWPDSVWDDVIKKNPEARQFRYKKLEYSDELSKMFEGTLATGEFAASVHTDDGANGDEGEEEPNEDDDMQDPYFEGISFVRNKSPVHSTPAGEQSTNNNIGTSNTSSRKRKRREHTPDTEVQEIIDIIKKQHDYIVLEKEEKKIEREAQKALENNYSIGECMKMLNAMKTYMPITPTLLQLAIVKFVEKSEYRKAFMELEEEGG